MDPSTVAIACESLLYSAVRLVGIGGGAALIVTAALVLYRAWAEREWERPLMTARFVLLALLALRLSVTIIGR